MKPEHKVLRWALLVSLGVLALASGCAHRIYARPVTGVAVGLDLETPVHERVAGPLAALVQPWTAGAADGLMGRLPESTHVAYLAVAAAQVGDVLVRAVARTALAEDAEVGEDGIEVEETSGIEAGSRIEIGEGSTCERRVALRVEDTSVRLATKLWQEHEAQEQVATTLRYEVLGVEDEAGQGHHQRVAVREVVLA